MSVKLHFTPQLPLHHHGGWLDHRRQKIFALKPQGQHCCAWYRGSFYCPSQPMVSLVAHLTMVSLVAHLSEVAQATPPSLPNPHQLPLLIAWGGEAERRGGGAGGCGGAVGSPPCAGPSSRPSAGPRRPPRAAAAGRRRRQGDRHCGRTTTARGTASGCMMVLRPAPARPSRRTGGREGPWPGGHGLSRPNGPGQPPRQDETRHREWRFGVPGLAQGGVGGGAGEEVASNGGERC
jgi:hypothetical protein